MQYDRLIEHLSYTIETDRFGTTRYRNRDGQLHRIDGPALERYSGTQEWYKNGVLHRTDGPAIIGENGLKVWYLNGICVSEKEFHRHVRAGFYHEP